MAPWKDALATQKLRGCDWGMGLGTIPPWMARQGEAQRGHPVLTPIVTFIPPRPQAF